MPAMTFITALKAVLDTPSSSPRRKLEINEVKALTPSDKVDLAEYLAEVGYEITNKSELLLKAGLPSTAIGGRTA